jgi:hypothetical protein
MFHLQEDARAFHPGDDAAIYANLITEDLQQIHERASLLGR